MVGEIVQADISWLQDNIAQRLTLSLPRASQVVEMRRGDCNEFAALLTALLRAQGIPCRPVAGDRDVLPYSLYQLLMPVNCSQN